MIKDQGQQFILFLILTAWVYVRKTWRGLYLAGLINTWQAGIDSVLKAIRKSFSLCILLIKNADLVRYFD